LSLPKVIVDQIAREIERTLRHRHDSREGCRAIDTDMQITSRVRVIPPFKVHSRALVRNLNANLLQGRTVAQILAEFSSGVSSIGKYGEAETLVGPVKFKEGSNVIITRDDALNALIIASTGGLTVHDNAYHDPDYTPFGHTHVEADITNLLHDALKIKGKTVDDSAIGDNKILVYKTATQTLVYEDKPSGGGGAAGWQNCICYPWAGIAVLDEDPDFTYTSEVSENAGNYIEVAWFDFDIPAGTIKSIFANLVWAMKITGSGTGYVKWQIASGSHASPGTWVDITDEVSTDLVSYSDKSRSGIIHKITNLTTTTPFTIRCLVKKGTATSAEAKVKSSTYLRVTYKVT